MKFYVGLHMPSHAPHVESAFISVNRLWGRRKPVLSKDWIMDSGAFTEISTHGEYRVGTEVYAEEILRQRKMSPGLVCAVAQDYMCEPHILKKTGKTIAQHQELTVQRYDSLLQDVRGEVPLLPVLQGYAPDDYIRHIRMYGSRLTGSMYVGVGSVCKRNTNVKTVEAILDAVRSERPDLRLHGFGLKITALKSLGVRKSLESSDSIAWSYAARIEGRNQNSYEEAQKYVARVHAILSGSDVTPTS